MARSLLTLLTIAAAAAACEQSPSSRLTAPAPDLSSAGPVVATATGSAHRVRADRLFALSFESRRYADGTGSGSYHADFMALGISFDVDVTCMSVSGNTAWIAGVIRDAKGPLVVPGTISYFYVTDNGEGSGDAADRVSALAINEPAGEDTVFCDDQPLILVNVPVELGNVQVSGGA